MLRHLRYNPDVVDRDLVFQLQLGGSLELPQQARLSDLVQSSRLKEWLQSTKSDLLFIHGNSSSDDIGAVLSFFSAKVLASFRDADPVIAIHYFYNPYFDRSTDDDHNYVDSASMMSSLLSQLLSQEKFDFDLSSVVEQELSGLSEHSLKTTCVLFARFLKQLPHATALILVIDDISRLEDVKRYNDTKKAVNHIVRLTQQTILEGNVVFKVLITSSCESRLPRECNISGDYEIFLEEDLVDDDGQGFEEGTMEDDMTF